MEISGRLSDPGRIDHGGGRRTAWRKALIVVGILLLSTGCSPSRAYEAALVLADITAGEEPSRLKDSTPEPQRETIAYTVRAQGYRGDLYLPGAVPEAALVLVPGAAEKGKDDPRLIAFATTLARARFLVLVPSLESLGEQHIRPENSRLVSAALHHLQERGAAEGRPLGAGAFSYAVGPTILAALEPDLAPALDFILGVGGYYDLTAVLTFFTTGDYQVDGEWRHREPNRYGKWLFIHANLERLDDAYDRDLFREMVARKKRDLEAPLTDLAAGLSPQGKSLYRFITNTDREKVPQLIAQLPQEIRSDIRELDLANKNLSRLDAHLFLVHGRNDPIIPYTESLTLARNLPEKQADVYIVKGLMHVDVEPGLTGALQMWRAVYALLGVREEQSGSN